MSSNLRKIITRRYKITESVIKEKLGLLGDLQEMIEYSGLSMNEVEAGLSHDMVVWEFVTVEISDENNILL